VKPSTTDHLLVPRLFHFFSAPLEDLHFTQLASRHSHVDGHVPGSAEEVEMGLLAGDEHASRFREDLGDGSEDEDEGKYEDSEESQSEVAQAMRRDVEMKAPLTREDKKAMALLIVLCTSTFLIFTY
jgi:hypothetical protein